MVQAILLRSYAMLGAAMDSHCLDALATQAQVQLQHFDAQALATLMWAFAKLSYSPDATLLRSCEAHAVRIAGAFTSQCLVRCCFLNYVSSLQS